MISVRSSVISKPPFYFASLERHRSCQHTWHPSKVPRGGPSFSVLHGGWVLASPDAPAGFAIWGEQSPNVRIRPRVPRRRPASVDGRPPSGSRPALPPVTVPPHP